MALSPEGSHTIAVGSRRYRWLVSPIGSGPTVELIVEDAESPGQRIVHRLGEVHEGALQSEVTPQLVTEFIRAMRHRGWNPVGPGPDLRVGVKTVESPVHNSLPTQSDVTMVALSLKLRTALDPPRADYPWDHHDEAFNDVFCDGNTDDKALGSIVAVMLGDAKILPSSDRQSVFAQWEQYIRHHLDSDGDLYPGGFRIDGGIAVTQWEDLYLTSGCCVCISQWRSWAGLLPTGESPWNGHDPMSSATLIDDSRVQLLPGRTSVGPPIEVSIADYRRLIYSLRADIQKFADRFERWAHRHAPAQAQLLADTMRAYLGVSYPPR